MYSLLINRLYCALTYFVTYGMGGAIVRQWSLLLLTRVLRGQRCQRHCNCALTSFLLLPLATLPPQQQQRPLPHDGTAHAAPPPGAGQAERLERLEREGDGGSGGANENTAGPAVQARGGDGPAKRRPLRAAVLHSDAAPMQFLSALQRTPLCRDMTRSRRRLCGFGPVLCRACESQMHSLRTHVLNHKVLKNVSITTQSHVRLVYIIFVHLCIAYYIAFKFCM